VSDEPAVNGQTAPEPADRLAAIDPARRAVFAAIADHLIPEAHGMPSAAAVIDDRRFGFVLNARPDLLESLLAALGPGLPDDPAARLAVLERDEPDVHGALLLAVVGGYYTDKDVRDRLRYPGQEARTLYSWQLPVYIEEGLIDRVLARGPVWKDPATGRMADPAAQAAVAPAWRVEAGDAPAQGDAPARLDGANQQGEPS
jgi:hypothetical protein